MRSYLSIAMVLTLSACGQPTVQTVVPKTEAPVEALSITPGKTELNLPGVHIETDGSGRVQMEIPALNLKKDAGS